MRNVVVSVSHGQEHTHLASNGKRGRGTKVNVKAPLKSSKAWFLLLLQALVCDLHATGMKAVPPGSFSIQLMILWVAFTAAQELLEGEFTVNMLAEVCFPPPANQIIKGISAGICLNG